MSKPKAEVDVVRGGKKIIVPDGMDLDTAITWLERKKEHEETYVDINLPFDAYPWDGSRAMMTVLHEKYGFVGDSGCSLIQVEVAYKEFENIVWGTFSVPGIAGKMTTVFSTDEGTPRFALKARVKRKHEQEMEDIATAIRAELKRNSIYRGKAVQLKIEYGEVDVQSPPHFMDLTKSSGEELILNPHIAASINANVLTPIVKSEWCRKHGIPLKRGVLLAGQYGTGKTLTATITARTCVEHNWTFVYLESPSALPSALPFAKMYGPSVIFCEDLDRAVGVMSNDDLANDVANAIDSIDTKGHDVMIVLTTNHPEQVRQKMLRPGRLDVIVHLEPPDAETAERLIRFYGRGLIPDGEDLSAASALLAGQIPAVIREAVERAKLFAIAGGQTSTLRLTGEAVALAARHMAGQIALMNSLNGEKVLSPTEKLAEAFVGVLGSRRR